MRFALLSCLLLAPLASFAQSSPPSPAFLPRVVVTTGMIADLVENLAPTDAISLQALMGPGVDPHLYRPTQGDLKRLQAADLVFYNGLKLEGKMQDIFLKLARKKRVVAVSSKISSARLLAFESYPGEKDPHIWFDALLWAETLPVVRDELIALLPSRRAEIEQNCKKYESDLRALDSWARAELEKVPASRRVLITAHDAFHYFGRAYGLEVLGLQGISTESEFGLQDLKRISDLIIERKVPAVFVETSVSEKFVLSLRDGVRARGFEVLLGGSLFSDAMGAADTEQGTYVGMFKHNVKTILKGLK